MLQLRATFCQRWRHILGPRGNVPLHLRSRRSARNRAKNGDYHGKKIGKKGLDRPERLRPSRTTWDPTRCSLLLHKSCTERTLKGMARSPFDSQRRWPKQDAGAMGKLLSTTWRFSNAHKDLRGIAPRMATTTAARSARWSGPAGTTRHFKDNLGSDAIQPPRAKGCCTKAKGIGRMLEPQPFHISGGRRPRSPSRRAVPWRQT